MRALQALQTLDSPVDTVVDEEYRIKARQLHHVDGHLEIDGAATVSRGSDNGAYVQAWLWMPDEEVFAHGS